MVIDVSSLFPGVGDSGYLNTASMALGNAPAIRALQAASNQWSSGTFDWPAAEAVGEDLRRRVAGLIGADGGDIAFVAGAAGGAATVASQLPRLRPGGNIVVPRHDFASNFLAWQLLGSRGHELRLVDDHDGVLMPDAFRDASDRNTAVIAVSSVQSATGFRLDLDALKTLAQAVGAWLVLDASQALGAVPFDVDGVSAMFSASHKWLLGMRGIGHLYLDPSIRDSFELVTPGWKSITNPVETFYGPELEVAATSSRFDSSWPWFNPLADIEGIRIIEQATIAAVERHNMALVDRLEASGVTVPFDASNRTSIVSIAVDDESATMNRMRDAGIVASARAGRVRVSFHLYNTADDVDRLVDVLQ